MATQTSNLNLTLPIGSENVSRAIINGNFSIIDTEAGKTRGNIASAYSASSAYAVGDCCIYGGDLYRCTTAIASPGEAWNSSHWTQVSVGNLLGSMIGLSKGYLSNANDDLDNGVYYTTSASQNVPSTLGVLLNMKALGGAARRFQLCFYGTNMWYRFGAVNNNVLTWNGWMKVTATAV